MVVKLSMNYKKGLKIRGGGKKHQKGVKPITPPLKKSDSKYVKYACKIEPKLVQNKKNPLKPHWKVVYNQLDRCFYFRIVLSKEDANPIGGGV